VDDGWKGKEELAVDQAKLAPAGNGLGTALHPELPENMVGMGFDCACGDEQPGGNLAVGETCRHQLEDFLFAGAERLY